MRTEDEMRGVAPRAQRIAPSAPEINQLHEQGEQRQQRKRRVRSVAQRSCEDLLPALRPRQAVEHIDALLQSVEPCTGAQIHAQREVRADAEALLPLALGNLLGDFLALGLSQILLEVDVWRASEAQQREQRNRQHEEQPRRTDVSSTAAGQVLTSQKAGSEQQAGQRAPHPSIEGHIAPCGFAQHGAHRRQRETRLLAATGAIGAGRDRAAVPARVRSSLGRKRNSRWAVNHGADWIETGDRAADRCARECRAGCRPRPFPAALARTTGAAAAAAASAAAG